MDWLKASATEQGRAIMAGLVSPLDLVEGYLDAIARAPLAPRIYARLTPERARAGAIAAHDRAKLELRRGLLDGVAISWKDNIDSGGIVTEAGVTRATFYRHFPGKDDLVVPYLQAVDVGLQPGQ